jgi:hypothetical protein
MVSLKGATWVQSPHHYFVFNFLNIIFMSNVVGEGVSKALCEVEDVLWGCDFAEARVSFTDEGFRASVKVFMSALMDKMYELQDKEGLSLDVRLGMAQKAGDGIRDLVKIYTNLDTHELYK